jgi:hypothetical protein
MLFKSQSSSRPDTMSQKSLGATASAKKTWLLPDKFLHNVPVLTASGLLIYCRPHGGLSPVMHASLCAAGFVSGDFISGMIHLMQDNYIGREHHRPFVVGDVLHIHTASGISSAHHLFPSNWKDIPDSVIIRTGVFLMLPAAAIQCIGRNDYVGAWAYYTAAWSIASVLSHKYAHERNHGRHVPRLYRLLQDTGLFLAPEEHRRHHINGHGDYAAVNGISAGVIDTFARWMGLDNIPSEMELLNGIRDSRGIARIKFTGDIEQEISYICPV